MPLTAAERLREVLNDANSLHLKGRLEGDDLSKFNTLVNEAKSLQGQLETAEQLSAVSDWAGKSAGMLPLGPSAADAPVGQASVAGYTEAGATKVGWNRESRKSAGFEILDQYGEGIQSSKTWKTTSTPEYRDAFKSYFRKPISNLKAGELKILQEGLDTEGGFSVPPDILERVIAKEPTPTRVAGRVTQLQTMRDKVVMPRINYTTDDLYTTGIRVTWTGEIPASSSVANVTDPLFGQTDIPIYTAMLKILLTNDLIEDAGFPVVSYVTDKFSETIDLLKDNLTLNGTGIGQPTGILANPGGTNQPAIVLSGTAGTLGTDGTSLVKAAFALPEQYDDNAAWVFNKTNVGAAIAQLQDSNKRFLWGAGLQDSGLDVGWKNRQLLGYPVVLSGFAPNIGAANYPIVFGDLRGYYLVNRIGFSIQVLREVYAEVNQIAIVGRIRFGGQVVEPWRMKALKSNDS